MKAHSGDITDIAIHQSEKANIVVSSARDRTVQVFQKTNEAWGLMQTLDDHTASISKVLLLENGTRLLSCSTDRTVVVRELVQRETDGGHVSAYIPIRTLVLKASVIHMTQVSESLPHLIVSSMDRQIQKFDVNTGKVLHSFRTTDDTGDAVVMDCISLSKERIGGRRVLAGVATTDKSIRLYDLNGNLIDKEWGHTEGVTDVALLETGSEENETDAMIVISTGTDGTVMIWDFNPRSNDSSSSESSVSSKPELTAAKAPIRRILSKSELGEFTPKALDREVIINGTPSGLNSVNSSPPKLKKRNSTLGINGIKNLPMVKIAQGRGDPIRSDSGDSSAPNTPLFGGELNPPASTGLENKKPSRARSVSPPESSKVALSRRPSNDSRRGKNIGPLNGNVNDPSTNQQNNVNSLAENLLKSLRVFREGVAGNARGALRAETIRDLEKELGLTTKELGEKGHKKKGNNHANVANEQLMAQFLDQYSERLISLIDSRLDEKHPKGLDQRGRAQECKSCEELSSQG